ncbi:MAG: hypothetical protein HON70_29410, partial [Lentisphaerae bacterium]|nr:hypothetical protein [Lentisphaerota bacterium]
MKMTAAKLALLVLLPFVHALAQPANAGRKAVAIVDVSASGLMPTAFTDLLFAACATMPGIALVEREELAALMPEQALVLAAPTTDSMAAATGLGQLCKADAFVLLEATKRGRGRGTPVRVRIVETRHGIKVFDTRLMVTQSGDEIADAIGGLSQRILASLRRVPEDPQELVLIGITPFASEEVARRWDWLTTALGAALEAQLARHYGVFLLERDKTRLLSQERDLAAALPQALLPSTLLVEGSYRLDRDVAPDALTVRYRCRSNGGGVIEMTSDGRIEGLAALADAIAREVLASAGQPAGGASSGVARDEALILAAEANRCRRVGDFGIALGLAEAAVALLPNRPELDILILRILRGYITHDDGGNSRSATARLQLLAWHERGAMIVERLMRHPDVLRNAEADGEWARFVLPRTLSPTTLLSNGFGAARDLLCEWYEPSSGAELEAFLSPPLAGDVARLRELKHQMHDCLSKVAAEQDDRRHFASLLDVRIHRSQGWFAQADGYVAMRNTGLRDAAALLRTPGRSRSTAVWVLSKPSIRGSCLWSNPGGLRGRSALLRGGLDGLARDQDPWLRAHAMANLALLAGHEGQHPEAQKHYERLTETVWRDIDPTLGDATPVDRWHLSGLLQAVLMPDKLAPTRDQSRAFARRQCREFADRVVATGHPMRLLGWKRILDAAVRSFERSGQPGTSLDLLNRSLAVLEGRSLLTSLNPVYRNQLDRYAGELSSKKRELVEVHGLGSESTESDIFEGQLVARLADLRGLFPAGKHNPHFRRILVTSEAVILVCAVGWNQHAQAFGVIRLSLDTWETLSHQLCDHELPTPRSIGPVYVQHRRWGPSVALIDSSVYVGTPWDGLRIFTPGNPVRYMTEEHGLATNAIRQLDVLGNVVYAFTGSGHDDYTGVMALDPSTGISRMLWSSREKTGDSVLSGLPLNGMAPDPRRDRLWVLTGRNPADRRRMQLYHYTPETGEIGVHDFEILERMRNRRFGDSSPWMRR